MPAYLLITWATEATTHLYYYYTYTTAIITTYEYHLCLPTFGLHGPQRPQPTYTITIPIQLLLQIHMNIIYPYVPLDYMGHRGHSPLMLLLDKPILLLLLLHMDITLWPLWPM